MKISIIHSQHSLPFWSIKMFCTKSLNLTIRFGYNFRIQFYQEDKQLKFAPQLDKFA